MILREFHIENVEEWGRYLVDKYPLILTEFHPDVAYYFKGDEKNRVNLRYGLEFQKGWLMLAEEVLAKATEIVTQARQHDKTAFIHSFIWKEKMGSMRWQGDSKLPEKFSKEWDDFLDEIEERSFNTCECCGQPGKVDGKGGWIVVRCLECKK